MKKRKKPDSNPGLLSQKEIIEGVTTLDVPTGSPDPAGTKNGKNTGAKPAAFKGQQSYHT